MNPEGPAAPLYWRVELERARLGWSATDLAEKSGVDRATVHRMRTGRRAPLPATVLGLAQALGIDQEEALRLAGIGGNDLRDATPGLPLHQRAEYERARRGLTKEQLAKKTGLSRVTYDRIATQNNPPQAGTVRKLCEVLGIPLAEGLRLASLADDTEVAPLPPSLENLLVAELSRRLPDVDRRTLARVLEHTADILQSAADVIGEASEGTTPRGQGDLFEEDR